MPGQVLLSSIELQGGALPSAEQGAEQPITGRGR